MKQTLQTEKEKILEKGRILRDQMKAFDNDPCRICGLDFTRLDDFLSQSLDHIAEVSREETIREIVSCRIIRIPDEFLGLTSHGVQRAILVEELAKLTEPETKGETGE